MAVPLRWRLKNVGRVYRADNDAVVIVGDEKFRGPVGITMSVSEARWLLSSLRDLERVGELDETAGQAQGAYVVSSLS